MTPAQQQNTSLFDVPAQPRRRSSDVLQDLLGQLGTEAITLRQLVEQLGDRTFGIVLVLMAVFNLIPVISIIAGLLVSLLGLQMVLGLNTAPLPRAVLDRPLNAAKVRTALAAIAPKVRWLERYVRPRWPISEAPIVARLNGIAIMLLGLVITLPVPLINIVPALIVVMMGVALLERDGLLQAIAAGLTLLVLVVMLLMIYS
jgi:hypothetical protein